MPTESRDEVAVSGGCLCGAVTYEVHGPLRPVIYCHCEQCRRTSGHYVAATAAEQVDLKMRNETGLRWYRSSGSARRGFCALCGSSLFWHRNDHPTISIMAGSLRAPTGLDASAHIFVDDANDYYVLCDGLPQYPQDTP